MTYCKMEPINYCSIDLLHINKENPNPSLKSNPPPSSWEKEGTSLETEQRPSLVHSEGLL